MFLRSHRSELRAALIASTALIMAPVAVSQDAETGDDELRWHRPFRVAP